MKNNVFNIVNIADNTNFWLVRTKKGLFFDDYFSEKFIALGWNYVDKKTIATVNEKQLKETVSTLYKTKTGTSIINKSNRFINEMKPGDIVMIPSANNSEILFAEVGDYFETQNTLEEEEKLIGAIDSGKYKNLDLTCPYKKRRHIKPLKIIQGHRLNPNLYKPLISRHGISKINDHAIYILSSIYNFYTWNNNINIVINVEEKNGINAKSFSKIIYYTTEILTINEDNYKITTRSNINSPGDIIISVLSAGKEFIIGNWLPIFILWGAISGIKIGPLELKSIPEAILNLIEKKSNIDMSKLEKDEKRVDIESKKIENEMKRYDFEKRKILDRSANEIIDATNDLNVDQSASSTVININQTNDV